MIRSFEKSNAFQTFYFPTIFPLFTNMKKLNQHLLLAAATMLMAGTAYAQAPTNQYQGNPTRSLNAPTNSNPTPGDVTTAGPNSNNTKGSYSTSYGDYSQDSYVSQTGTGNYATVDQLSTAGASRGNTAILNQNGNYNKASQTQSSTGAGQGFSSGYYTGSDRNFMRSTQNGSNSQTQQSQSSGFANSETVLQGAGTTNNRAIQTQGVNGSGPSVGNQAVINQTRYAVAGGGSNNYAEQVQTGLLQGAQIDQEASSSYAKQTQKGGADQFHANDAYIHQGDPGTRNSAEQSQDGVGNVARIQQGIGGTTNNSYAMQTQTGTNNQADIDQHLTTGSYAEQMQTGTSNYSSMTQANVRSAAYSVQSGTANTAIINQH